MDQTDQKEQTDRIYRIGDVAYHLEPASFEQHRWLADGPMKDVDFGQGLSGADVETLIQRAGPELLGMVLVAEGQTRAQKAAAGLDAARQLGRAIACQWTPAEVRDAVQNFFLIDGHANLAFFVNVRALRERAVSAIATSSNPPSASLPTATCSGPEPSGSAPDLLRPSWPSSDSVSDAPTSAPSSASVG